MQSTGGIGAIFQTRVTRTLYRSSMPVSRWRMMRIVGRLGVVMFGVISNAFGLMVPHGKLSECIALLEEGMQALSRTPYHYWLQPMIGIECIKRDSRPPSASSRRRLRRRR